MSYLEKAEGYLILIQYTLGLIKFVDDTKNQILYLDSLGRPGEILADNASLWTPYSTMGTLHAS